MLSILGKMYARMLIDKVMEMTECRISEEQGNFKRGRGCVDQIFEVR